MLDFPLFTPIKQENMKNFVKICKFNSSNVNKPKINALFPLKICVSQKKVLPLHSQTRNN